MVQSIEGRTQPSEAGDLLSLHRMVVEVVEKLPRSNAQERSVLYSQVVDYVAQNPSTLVTVFDVLIGQYISQQSYFIDQLIIKV
jgi:predicted nucleic-acid-binding protein